MDEVDFVVDRPAFVIGTGRSGLTPLMHLIAYHEEFAWPSQFNKRFPNRHSVSVLSRIVGLPVVRSRLKYFRYLPTHSEAYPFWDGLFLGWTTPFRDLVAEDVSPSVRRKFRRAVAQVMRFAGKRRFIAEYSGWSRIGFLRAVFPDARFIHIVRDGRAVANSLTKVAWWRGWQGVDNWRVGRPSEELLRQLERYDFSFLALAAVHWKILVNNILEQSSNLPENQSLLVRYEDLVTDPLGTVDRCAEFLEIDGTSRRFRRHLATVKIIDANTQHLRIAPWRSELTAKQTAMLNDLLADDLHRLNYE